MPCLCPTRGCAACRGQGEALNIDRREFYNELYSALQDAPYHTLLEGLADVLYSASRSQPPPSAAAGQAAAAAAAEAAESASVRLLRLADQMLCGTKMVDGHRLAAFAKRLTALSLAEASSEAIGCLALVNRLVRRHSKLRSMLEFERSGSSGPSFPPLLNTAAGHDMLSHCPSRPSHPVGFSLG